MRFHEILFWLLILLLPLQLGKHLWPDFSLIFGIKIDYLSPIIYLTDILVFLILIFWGVERLRNSKFEILKRFFFPFLIFGFLFLGSLFSQNPGVAFYKFIKIIEFSLLGLYIAKNHPPAGGPITLPCRLASRRSGQAGNYQLPITLAVIYSSLMAIFQFIKQASLGGIFWWLGERSFSSMTPGIALGEIGGRLFLRPYGTFSHPNALAGFLLVSLILVAYNIKYTTHQKIVNWLAIGLGLMAILFSFSLAVWLVGGLIVLWLWFFGFWKGKKINSLITLVSFFLAGFAFLLVNSDLSSSESFYQRLQLIKASVLMISENPLSGVGLNNFIVRLPEFWQTTQVRLLQPVHNIYLLVAAETGIVGLLIFLWFLYLTFKKLAASPSPLAASLIAILALGLFDHYWLTLQQNQLLLAIVLGLSWGYSKQQRKEIDK